MLSPSSVPTSHTTPYSATASTCPRVIVTQLGDRPHRSTIPTRTEALPRTHQSLGLSNSRNSGTQARALPFRVSTRNIRGSHTGRYRHALGMTRWAGHTLKTRGRQTSAQWFCGYTSQRSPFNRWFKRFFAVLVQIASEYTPQNSRPTRRHISD